MTPSRPLLVGATLVATVLMATAVAEAGKPAWVVLLAAITASAALVLVVARRAHGRVAFWQASTVGVLFFFLTNVARPVQLLWRGADETLHEHGPDVLAHGTRTLEAALLELLVALVTYWLLVLREPPRTIVPTWSSTRRVVAVAVAAAASLGGVLALSVLGGGLGEIFTHLFTRRENLAGHFYFTLLVYCLPACVLYLVYDRAYRRIRSPLLLGTGLLSLLVILPLGGRAEYLILGTGVLAVWQVCGRRIRWPAVLGLAVIAGVVVSGGLALRLRTSDDPTIGRERLSEFSISPTRLVPTVVEDGFANFDRSSFAMAHIPGEVPYQGLTNYWRLAAAPIPRAVWPDKPAQTEANVTAALFGTTIGSNSLGPVGGAWLEGGWLGVAVAGVVTGGLWALLGAWVCRASNLLSRTLAIGTSFFFSFGVGNQALVDGSRRALPVLVVGLLIGSRRLVAVDEDGVDDGALVPPVVHLGALEH
jgi:hypothetical protein